MAAGTIGGAGGNINYTGTGGGNGQLNWTPQAADEAFQAQQAGQQRTANQQLANTAAAAQEYPATLAQQRFNQVYPWVQGQFGNLTGNGGLFGQNNAGSVGQGPAINTGPVWSPSQIQQQVNNQTAQNDAATGGQLKQINQSTAGRGFGSNSPLAQALGVAAQGQNRATNTQNAQQTQWNAAQGNAQQQLAGQGLQEQQYESQQQQATARGGIIAGSYNALLASLAGMA